MRISDLQSVNVLDNADIFPMVSAASAHTRKVSFQTLANSIRDLIVASAPTALDTLDELANALGDDANFASTVTTNLASKLAKSANLSDLADVPTARTNLGLGSLALKNSLVANDIPATLNATSFSSTTYLAQGSTPAAPASGFIEFADATGRRSWRRASDGFVRTWDATLTANRVYTLPDADSALPVFSQTVTFTGPTAARTVTLPDANFTVARRDAAQTFTGSQTFSGQILASDGSVSAPAYAFANEPGTGIYHSGATTLDFASQGTRFMRLSGSGVEITTLYLGAISVFDVVLTRDAANTLALRNGANAQTQRWYASYTDASNYTRASLSASTSAVTLAAESAGTGSANLDLVLTPKGTGAVRPPSGNAFILGDSTNTWQCVHTYRVRGSGGSFDINGVNNTAYFFGSGISITGSGSSPFLNLAGTWNTTGAPNAIALNVTDTASASGSLLMRLQLGGADRFKVDKSGNIDALASYRVNGTKVIGTQTAGWTLPTSALKRNAADYSALTDAEVRQVLAAIVNDLHAAGTGSNNGLFAS